MGLNAHGRPLPRPPLARAVRVNPKLSDEIVGLCGPTAAVILAVRQSAFVAYLLVGPLVEIERAARLHALGRHFAEIPRVVEVAREHLAGESNGHLPHGVAEHR